MKFNFLMLRNKIKSKATAFMSKQRSGLRMSVLLREEDFNVWQKEKETEQGYDLLLFRCT